MGKRCGFAQSSKNKPRKRTNFPAPSWTWNHSRASLYSEKHWNVISPVDNFGYAGRGSWWTGEDGNLDTSNLLVDVVSKSKQLLGLSEDAILCIRFEHGWLWGNHNGCILGAKAVYANVPQIKLLGSTYSELGMKKFFDAVLGSTPNPLYNDLNEFIRNFNGEFPHSLFAKTDMVKRTT